MPTLWRKTGAPRRIRLVSGHTLRLTAQSHVARHFVLNNHLFKAAKDLQDLAAMLAPHYGQSQIREFYLNGLLPDFIGTDMDYWMLIRRYYALKDQDKVPPSWRQNDL